MKKRITFCIFILSVLAVYTGYQAINNNNENLLYVFSIFAIIIAICVAVVLANFDSSSKDSFLISNESLSENDDYYKDNLEKSLALFQKDREEELGVLLEQLANARVNLSESIKSGDIKKISDAKIRLDTNLDGLMTFLENYSKFGKMIHHKNQSDKF